jgi:hypothetical protein
VATERLRRKREREKRKRKREDKESVFFLNICMSEIHYKLTMLPWTFFTKNISCGVKGTCN